MVLVRRIGLGLAAPVLALAISAIFSSLLLLSTGDDIAGFWRTLFTAPENRNIVNILNYGSLLYMSGIAAAIGFRMNLFNIGVDGQYRIGFFVAAVVAGEAWLPGKANTVLAIAAAMLAGALWAGIAGVLRVTRGVSEVISTIMLNAISALLVGYLVKKVGISSGVTTGTKPVPKDSWVGGISLFSDVPTELFGLAILAPVLGIAFFVVVNRTRFGYNLRATGTSQTAAVAAGVDVRRMVVISMLLSGMVAGLIGMATLFGSTHNYGSSFQSGIGFAGIAVALLGRNNPVGIAFAALIFSFLQDRGGLLNITAGISPEIIAVTQGIIVLAVVIAYEIVRRYRVTLEQAAVAREIEEVRA
jgi:simple sugar transport system permease protein